MQTAKAQLGLYIYAVWSGPSLSANRMVRYYRRYECRAKAQMILCACAGWSESSHFVHVQKHFLFDMAHIESWAIRKITMQHVNSKDPDQTGQMPSLVWAFAVHVHTGLSDSNQQMTKASTGCSDLPACLDFWCFRWLKGVFLVTRFQFIQLATYFGAKIAMIFL